MAKRSYQQNCSLALALDIIGERWSLLLVRELLTGPKRFNELLASLPGMGTNLLASRLKELEANTLVRQCERNAGSAYKSYELSELGQELEEPVLALVKWGNHFRDRADENYLSRPHWLMVAFKAAFRSERALGIEAAFEIESEGFLFHISIKHGQCFSVQGPIEDPVFRLKIDSQVLAAIANRETDWDSALKNNMAEVKGNKRVFQRIWKLFQL